MGDLISRSELSAAIKRQYCTDCNNYNGLRCRACHADDMLALVDDSLDAGPLWISVEDEYPDYKLSVLVIAREYTHCKGETVLGNSVHVGYTRGEDEGWFDWYTGDWLDVTHWMRIPESEDE